MAVTTILLLCETADFFQEFVREVRVDVRGEKKKSNL